MELKAEKTAILFIEYQNEFLSEGGNLNDGIKDFVEESNMIGNSVDLANKAREKGVETRQLEYSLLLVFCSFFWLCTMERGGMPG